MGVIFYENKHSHTFICVCMYVVQSNLYQISSFHLVSVKFMKSNFNLKLKCIRNNNDNMHSRFIC